MALSKVEEMIETLLRYNHSYTPWLFVRTWRIAQRPNSTNFS